MQSTRTEETKEKEEIITYKFSNRGEDQLREAVIIEKEPIFIKYYCDEEKNKHFLQVEQKIDNTTSTLIPPLRKDTFYTPYEFKTVDEPQRYLTRAMKETPESLLAKIKILVKQFNDVSDKTATLLSANIFGSYFQDRFSTVHYLLIVGANGTGKSAFGDTFECLGYRPVNVTNATESFWFRQFGTIEYGQCTIIVEEFDRMEENSQVMSMLKVGYQPHGKVPRMNNELTKMEFFYPFCFKIMISEKSPNEDIARGVLDRSFKNISYKGTPDFNIKEIRNPQGNAKRQERLDAMNDLRKLLLVYRLVHIKDAYKEVEIGIDGRDEELCKPLLQLFYTLGASEECIAEIERTLQYFLDVKNDRKGDSLEASLYPIVVNALSSLGKDYVSLSTYDENEPKIQRSISTTDLWQQITSTLDGNLDQDKPNTFYSDEFDKLYRPNVIKIIRDKFGAEKDHKEKGNNLIFDLVRLDKMKRIYENDGKIKTKPIDPDSLIHPDDLHRKGYTDESGKSKDKNEVKDTDSPVSNTSTSGLSESVNQSKREYPDSSSTSYNKKCAYCDHEDHPYFLKEHVKNQHGEGKEPQIRPAVKSEYE